MTDVKELRLIAFRVGPDTFVVDIMAVRQIIPDRESTAVPTAPAFVEGIVVLRNEVIPIVDLRERFSVERARRAAHPLILITDTGAGRIGLKVDEVRTIVNVKSDLLLPPPEMISGIRGDLLIAIVSREDEVFLLIDIESVLSEDERTALQSAELSPEEASGGRSRR